MIVLHNVTHLVSGISENEFTFSEEKVATFVNWFGTSPIASFFSFFGWLGVSFFIFASAYGLTVKYGKDDIKPMRWIRNHYFKLFFLLLPALFVFVLFCNYLHPLGFKEWLRYICEQSLCLNIIRPDLISPGVYWYIGLAFQFYLWFLLFRKLSAKVLIAIAVAALIVLACSSHSLTYYLRHNSIGWMPEFIFGILAGRGLINIKQNNFVVMAAGIILLCAVSLTPYTYTLGGICFLLVILPISRFVSKSLLILFVGEISAALYVVHPVVRAVWLRFFHGQEVLSYSMLSAIAVLLISVALSIPYQRFYRHLRTILKSP